MAIWFVAVVAVAVERVPAGTCADWSAATVSADGCFPVNVTDASVTAIGVTVPREWSVDFCVFVGAVAFGVTTGSAAGAGVSSTVGVPTSGVIGGVVTLAPVPVG